MAGKKADSSDVEGARVQLQAPARQPQSHRAKGPRDQARNKKLHRRGKNQESKARNQWHPGHFTLVHNLHASFNLHAYPINGKLRKRKIYNA
jgi:hypothetical protein